MARLTIEIPDMTMRRLHALALASGKSLDEVVLEGLASFVGSRSSRRTIRKSRKAAADAQKTSCSLVDLGWLEGYSGQTFDELLAMEPHEDAHVILLALEEAIRQKIKTLGPLRITGVELILLSVMSLQREVNNGGFDQFFRNSSRKYAPVIVNHLLIIGCPEIAEVAQQALDALHLDANTLPAVEAEMTTHNVARDRALNRCNLEFYGQPGPTKKLFQYVKAHPDAIGI